MLSVDFNDDSDVWKPVMIDEMGANYPTIASFATSTFKEFCRLGEVSFVVPCSLHADRFRSFQKSTPISILIRVIPHRSTFFNV